MKPSNVKKQLREYALAAVKKSILLNPRNWQHWNLLGVVAASVGMWYK
jgi:Flp pilus assembly protein TadD